MALGEMKHAHTLDSIVPVHHNMSEHQIIFLSD